MVRTIHVLIVEDDFRVAEINRRQIEQLSGYRVAAETKTAADTLLFLQQADPLPDVIVLDVYIPDSPGLGLFWSLRKDFPLIDIILLTAAKETETAKQALHAGVFDYLLKPVDPERFVQTLKRYRARKVLLSSKQELSQKDLDRLFGIEIQAEAAQENLPKGIDQLTLERIEMILNGSEGITAAEAGRAAGVSRSTARRYLEYLAADGKVQAQLLYGDVGRPERTYKKT